MAIDNVEEKELFDEEINREVATKETDFLDWQMSVEEFVERGCGVNLN